MKQKITDDRYHDEIPRLTSSQYHQTISYAERNRKPTKEIGIKETNRLAGQGESTHICELIPKTKKTYPIHFVITESN